MLIKLTLIICVIFALNEAAALAFHENISVEGGGQLACRTDTQLTKDWVDASGTQKYSRSVNFDMEKENASLISSYNLVNKNKKSKPDNSSPKVSISASNSKGNSTDESVQQDSVRQINDNDYMHVNFNLLPIYSSSFRVKSASNQPEQFPNLGNPLQNRYGIKMTNPYQLEHGIEVSGADNFNADNSISFGDRLVTTSYSMDGKGILKGSVIESDTMGRPHYLAETYIMDTNFTIGSGVENEAVIGEELDTKALSKEVEKVETGSKKETYGRTSTEAVEADYALDEEYEIGEELKIPTSLGQTGVNELYLENKSYTVAKGEILKKDESEGLLSDQENKDRLIVTDNLNPNNGTVEVYKNGALTYTPNENSCGNDSFNFYVKRTDTGALGTATVLITVLCDGPKSGTISSESDVYPTDDSYSIAKGEILKKNESEGLLINDDYRNNLIVTHNSDPNNGTVEVLENGSLSYAPSKNFCGNDSFDYYVKRTDTGGLGNATVLITVLCDGPNLSTNSSGKLYIQSASQKKSSIINAVVDKFSTRRNEPMVVDAARGVLSNDQGGNNRIAKIHSLPEQGKANLSKNGSLIYAPNKDFCGEDKFNYTVIDLDTQESSMAEVIIEVVCTNGTVIPGSVFGSSLNSIYASGNPIISGTSWGMAYIGYYYPAPKSGNYTVGSTDSYNINRKKGRYIITEKSNKSPKQKYLKIGSSKAPMNKVRATPPGARFDILEKYPL